MWERVGALFEEAFARLGAVLAADLPGIVAMLVVILGAILAAFFVRAVLHFALARVGFDRRAREWGMTAGRALEPHHEPSWLVARGAFWLVIATGIALALAVLGASTTSLARALPARASCRGSWSPPPCCSAGIGAGRFLERAVLIGAVNQGIRRAPARRVGGEVGRARPRARRWRSSTSASAASLPTIAFSIVVGGLVLARRSPWASARAAASRARSSAAPTRRTARRRVREDRHPPPVTGARHGEPRPPERDPPPPHLAPGAARLGRSRRGGAPLRALALRGRAAALAGPAARADRVRRLALPGALVARREPAPRLAGGARARGLARRRRPGGRPDGTPAAPTSARRAVAPRAARAGGAGVRGRRGAAASVALEAFRAREGEWLHEWALFAVLKDVHGGRAVDGLAGAAGAPRARRARRGAGAPRRGDLRGGVRAVVLRAPVGRAARPLPRARDRAPRRPPDLRRARLGGGLGPPELFRLDAAGRPLAVAGVPPDYFSATGQRWGNPLYDWAAIARDGWQFWLSASGRRSRSSTGSGSTTFAASRRTGRSRPTRPPPRAGAGCPAPGAELLGALERALGPLPLVAENLGVITPEVEALRRRFGLPGMAILQFAFGRDPQAPSFRPHAYERDTVAYTGTHDNDTVMGWWEGGAADSTRTAAEAKRRRRSRARTSRRTGGR